jgi:hypothetical protein
MALCRAGEQGRCLVAVVALRAANAESSKKRRLPEYALQHDLHEQAVGR